jgi:quercetin dioxygenase-like cupin family protein
VTRPPSIDDSDLPLDLQEALASAVQPAELGAGQRERMRRRVLDRASEQAPEGTRTLRAAHSAWIEVAPFIEVRELRRDEVAGTHMSLMRMRPGGVIPAHRHGTEEEFIVLEGECRIGSHQLRAGDVHIAASGSWHEPVTTQEGVLVLLRGEYPHPAPSAP